MKRLLTITALLLAMASAAQSINDTAQLRGYINTAIVPNNTRAITATVVNRAFNGVLNAYGPILRSFLDTLYFSSNIMYWRQRGILYSRPVGGAGLTYPLLANRYLNGYGSFVQLNSDSIAEGSTNRFFTTQRARQSLSGGAGINYDPVTGTIAATSSGGITGIGNFSASGDAKGASISGSSLILHPATATTPGGVSIDPQVLAGPKTFLDIATFRLASGGTVNAGTASLYLRDGGAAGRIGIGKELTSMHLFVPTDFSSFRFYGGGDFNSSASDWMTLNSSSLSLGTGVSLTLNEVLRTRQSGGGNVNAGTAAIYLRDGGAGQRIGLGKQLTSMHFFVPTDFSSYRWYAGGDFNNSATNWMNLDANALQVHSSLRLAGVGGYGSINEYTTNSLFIGGSQVQFSSPLFFSGPGYLRGRGMIASNGQAIFSDLNQDNAPPATSAFTVRSNSRGSLPFPSLTQAQRVAISNPEIGLHVYQTDGTEGVYVYKSSGWQLAY